MIKVTTVAGKSPLLAVLLVLTLANLSTQAQQAADAKVWKTSAFLDFA